MISDLWTLAIDDGEAATLSAWGVSSASLTFKNMAEDSLSLSLGTAAAMAGAAYGAEMVLYRDDVVFFRGTVTESPAQYSPASESRSVRVENVWRSLLDVDFEQQWNVWKGTAQGTEYSTRYRLGEKDNGDFETGAEMLAAVRSFASDRGVDFDFDLGQLPTRRPGIVEGDNQSIGQVIRQVMGVYPESLLVAEYSATGVTLKAVHRGNASAVEFDLDAGAVASHSIRSLDERQVDGVVLQYEASVSVASLEGAEEGLRRLDKVAKLAVFVDKFPGDLTPTARTLSQTLPAPDYSLATQTPPDVQWVRQAVTTQPLPQPGATDLAARKWWLDHAEALSAVGLTADDILLAATGTAEVRAHSLTLLPPPVEERVSPVNPNSTPVFHTDSISDYPRELLEGAITDWMGATAADVVAEVTIGIRKSVVDALPAAAQEKFNRLGARELDLGGTATYALDRTVRVRGTNATTKVYAQPVSVNFSGLETSAQVAAENQLRYDEAFEKAVIPGLAEDLFNDLSPLAFAGEIDLAEEEAGGRRYLGNVLNVVSVDNAAWADMRAQIQSESLTLETGETSLRFGPADHLSIQDRQSLHAVARLMQDRRKGAADRPKPGANANLGGGGIDAGSEESSAQQIGGSIGPVRDGGWDSGGTGARALPWEIKATGDSYQVLVGKVFENPVKLANEITISNAALTFAPAIGDAVWLEVTGMGVTSEGVDVPPQVSLVSGSQWSGFPGLFEWDRSGDLPVVGTARFVLWSFVAGALPDGMPGKQIVSTGAGAFYGRHWVRSYELAVDYIPVEDADTGHIAAGVKLFGL